MAPAAPVTTTLLGCAEEVDMALVATGVNDCTVLNDLESISFELVANNNNYIKILYLASVY